MQHTSLYAIFNDQSFNDTLTNYTVSLNNSAQIAKMFIIVNYNKNQVRQKRSIQISFACFSYSDF